MLEAIAIMPGTMTRNGNSIFGMAAMRGTRRAADPEPLDAHGIGRGVAHLAPGARPCPRGEALRRRHVRQPFGESLPAPQILEAEEHQRRETGDDEEELQHLVVDGRGESS